MIQWGDGVGPCNTAQKHICVSSLWWSDLEWKAILLAILSSQHMLMKLSRTQMGKKIDCFHTAGENVCFCCCSNFFHFHSVPSNLALKVNLAFPRLASTSWSVQCLLWYLLYTVSGKKETTMFSVISPTTLRQFWWNLAQLREQICCNKT